MNEAAEVSEAGRMPAPCRGDAQAERGIVTLTGPALTKDGLDAQLRGHAVDCSLPSTRGIAADGIARQGHAAVALPAAVPPDHDGAGHRGDAESAAKEEEHRDADGAVRWLR